MPVGEYVKDLLKELEVFRATFNRRLVYFKSLQEISDLVTPPEPKDVNAEIEECTNKITDLDIKLARMVVKGRYLQYLGTKEHDEDELREDCIICMGSSDDKHGVLLECGHFYCQVSLDRFRDAADELRISPATKNSDEP